MSVETSTFEDPRSVGSADLIDVDADSLLTALNDGDCRAILKSVREQPRSASELSECCDLPLSTTYRKLELMTDGALLEEQTRIRADGAHAKEYEPQFENLTISVGFDDEDGVAVEPAAD
ncbi:helix-turn-helix domain-containing protein [Haloarchaeobius sp. HME9146]|uniref:winged helix-turn-helix domain-containing protein n=1 Tax=Haloarchaeobius sp. HME9146 TaxID=2978732 RepID=UPI0021C2103E|nr:helix-turn-helix domain-containing protein [Haloarchaeobius sp. HME9146]MCT9096124.1 helix-turn-helix domain-containing protein [Haloarchaeobius sp. HME9146]